MVLFLFKAIKYNLICQYVHEKMGSLDPFGFSP